MHFNLMMLNLWIGLCRGTHGLPTAICRLGYDVLSIERGFLNQDSRHVRPEAVVASSTARHTILLEFKSGSNTDMDQLSRYLRVSHQDLMERCYVPPSAAENHDVIVIGQAEHAQRLQIGLQGDFALPLLIWGSNRLSLVANSLSSDALTEIFGPGLDVGEDAIPTGFVPIDGESEPWEVAEVIIPAIFPYFSLRARRVEVQQLAAEVCKATWADIAKPGRDPMCARINDVLRRAAERHFCNYFSYSAANGGSIELLRNPLDQNFGERAKTYRILQRAQIAFIEELRGDDRQLRLDF